MIRQGHQAIGIDGWAAAEGVTRRTAVARKRWAGPDSPPVINPVMKEGFDQPVTGREGRMWDLEEARQYLAGKTPQLTSRDPRVNPKPGDLLNDREIAFVMGKALSTVQRKRYMDELSTEPLEQTCGVPHTRRGALEEAWAQTRKDGPGSTPARVRIAQAMKENPGAAIRELAQVANVSWTNTVLYKAEIESGASLVRETGKDRLRRAVVEQPDRHVDESFLAELCEVSGLSRRVVRRYLNELRQERELLWRIVKEEGAAMEPLELAEWSGLSAEAVKLYLPGMLGK